MSDTDDPRASATQKATDYLQDDWRRHTYRVAATSGLAILALGTVVYHYAEDWGWIDAFYASSIALTTVGFGDFAPTRAGTKLFTVFYVFVGVGLIGVVMNEALRRHTARAAARHGRRNNSADNG